MRVMLTTLGIAAGLVGCATGKPQVDPGRYAPPPPPLCSAAEAASLVGTPVGAVTFPAGKAVRIVCTTCPTTRDYRPDRLNVRFDEATGIIRSVDCG